MQMQSEDTYNYGVIRRAIETIDAADHVLGLEELSRLMDLSPAHFQRKFSTWAGISPQKYQHYLTVGYAKTLLRDKCTTLMTADSVGLSGSGRLHDLFIRWEAMSPGDYAIKGAGLTIYEGWFSSPFGEVIAMGTNRGLCGLGFASEMGRDQARDDLVNRWPLALFEEKPNRLASWVEATFAGKGNVDLHVMGAPLQIKVWEALMRIPSGYVTTYSNIAQSIQNPKAVRAVGTAVGRNPVSFIIPCHRVLRKSGELGGYHWGTPVKRAILAFEGARSETTQ
ncbi:MAG: AraC family transcriptional regulator of adaptative response [Planktomarina sp.]|jgi:AraC family transcriptional regulator of adaptative response/methylated-DNA-[protein]-cysteine methyltransferase|tara:strand:+ start:802 stop:1644 length:843 start_codon:yes stop_codon:yes gene_type:complete